MPFENQLDLNIRAFFFNAKTDYLPYYKNFSFTLDNSEEMTLKQVLAMIKEQNPNFSYPDKDLVFRVNDLVVTGDEKVVTVVERLGSALIIDPALKYRSDNGLILNNHDFMHQFRRTIGHYTTKEDLAYYLTLYPLHYASETFNYNHEYIGDAILLLAAKMIADGNEHKKEILHAINDEFDGISCCEYENNLFDAKDHTQTIDELKNMIGLKSQKTLLEKILSKKSKQKDIDSLEGHRVALYVGGELSTSLMNDIVKLIGDSGAKFVEFGRSTKLAGQTLVDSNHKIAYAKAGAMLLDALDSGADSLIFAKDEDKELFSSIHAEVERAVGRDIKLTLISLSKLHELANGAVA